VTFSPTNLADFLACRHKTRLELEARAGHREKPVHVDPLADVLRKRGEEHERRYVERLRAEGLAVDDLSAFKEQDRDLPQAARVARTVTAMQGGADVIVQAPVGNAQWFGYADVLVKVPGTSALGDWHYEAHDTKLARETRAGAILQLCVYTEVLGELQGRIPTHFHVVTPADTHTYRFTDVAAYYRLVQSQLLGLAASGPPTYPDPVEHCGMCRWWEVCNAQRRADDHLGFVANLGRSHRAELQTQAITTLAMLATWEVPPEFRPKHGSRETYVGLRDQAFLQLEQRRTNTPQVTTLRVEPHVAPDGTPMPLRGFKRLPAPSAGDLYLDLEGDPFARNVPGGEAGEGSREYLFGLGWVDGAGQFRFRSWWAFTDAEEQKAFEDVMDEIGRVVAQHPDAHVYHYAPYEATAFKRLSGRYATRAEDLDMMLRSGRLVDLYAVVRQSIRAGVESYSIKELEQYYGFTRDVDLRRAGQERQAIEVALESGDLGAISQDIRDAVEGYNRDDVRSTLELHRWLERRRAEMVADGEDIPRPEIPAGEAPEEVGARDQRVLELRARLLAMDAGGDGRSRGLMAFLLDWHRRENKAEWWEFYRLKELDDESLLEERKAVSGLQWVSHVEVVRNKRTQKPTGSVVDRYRFPPQDTDVKAKDTLNLRDGTPWGDVVAVDRVGHAIDVKVGPSRADVRPTSAFAHEVISPKSIEDALFAIGTAIADGTLDPLAMSLLERQPGLITAIQGPPGTGKTYQGGVRICDLVAEGKSVGVTANSHAVIANMLTAVRKEAASRGVEVRLKHEGRENEFADDDPQVVGGTVWYWTSDRANPVDVLFVDEAGQMSLANTLACTVAAGRMVLLGDPQQLDQPTKGVHPDGVGASALEHMLGDHKTMPPERGMFLDVTWRLAPSICDFTSECFYESRLHAKPGLERQVLRGASRFSGAGLRIVPVEHDGNRNASDEEVAEVVRIVGDLLAPGSEWVNEKGEASQLTATDIRIVAPYNAQVARLQEALRPYGAQGLQPLGQAIPIGTVDKFQGQEAPIVIYSMATSRPEDAPRGLGFLYSLNRFNVATSRARCLCIVVASPRLFEPDCQTPVQMQMANALCRYVEMAGALTPPASFDQS
jgi:predicted RecB family nuclease